MTKGHTLSVKCVWTLTFLPILCADCFAAVFFLEYWKRKEITLAYQWDVLGFEEEEVLYMRLNDFLCIR